MEMGAKVAFLYEWAWRREFDVLLSVELRCTDGEIMVGHKVDRGMARAMGDRAYTECELFLVSST
jgi:hypothetical protein